MRSRRKKIFSLKSTSVTKLDVQVREVAVHLSTASHQLAWLAQAKPELYLQFAAHSSTSTETWDKTTLNSLDSVVNIVQNIMHLFLSGVSYVITKA